jgi:hypothetical protein
VLAVVLLTRTTDLLFEVNGVEEEGHFESRIVHLGCECMDARGVLQRLLQDFQQLPSLFLFRWREPVLLVQLFGCD